MKVRLVPRARFAGRCAAPAVGLAVAATLLCVYLVTLSPTIGVGDGGELIAAAATLGIPHPPGYPLWCLVMHPLTRLPVDPALAVNAGTALASALASWLFFRIATGPLALGTFLGASLALVHGLGPTLWRQSVETEIYAFNLALLLIFCLLYLGGHRRGGLLPYVGALAFISHGVNLSVLVPAAIARTLRAVVAGAGGARWMRSALWIVLGLSPLLYLPIRSSAFPFLDWGHPADLDGFLDHVTRRQYGGFRWPGGSVVIDGVGSWFRSASATASLLAWPLAIRGAVAGWRTPGIRTLVLWLVLSGPLTAAFLSGALRREQLIETDVFALPSFSFLLLLAALGLGASRRALGAALVLGWALWLGGTGLSRHDRSGNYLALDYGRALLDPLPPDAVLFVQGDYEAFSVMYLQAVVGERRDVSLRKIPPPDRVDLYGHAVPGAAETVGAGERPIFVTVPKAPFDASACVPYGLSFRYGAPTSSPWFQNVTLRHRSTSALGYFEKTVVANLYFHEAAYRFAVAAPDSALAAVDRAREVTGNPRMLSDLGTLVALNGHVARAEVLWRAATDRDPSYIRAWEHLVRASAIRGDHAAASAILLEALEANPGATRLLRLRREIASAPSDAVRP